MLPSLQDIRAREAEVGEARKAVHVIQAEHTAETKHLHKELTSRSAAASELERKLLGATSQVGPSYGQPGMTIC